MVATGVPLTQTMERVLGKVDVMSVEQTPRGCFQECLGCSARSEFILYEGYREGRMSFNLFSGGVSRPAGDNGGQIGYMLEESSFFDRCFWSGMRKMKIPIKVPNKDGEEMMTLTKDFSMERKRPSKAAPPLIDCVRAYIGLMSEGRACASRAGSPPTASSTATTATSSSRAAATSRQ